MHILAILITAARYGSGKDRTRSNFSKGEKSIRNNKKTKYDQEYGKNKMATFLMLPVIKRDLPRKVEKQWVRWLTWTLGR